MFRHALAAALVAVAVFAVPVSAKAGASITAPEDVNFGETFDVVAWEGTNGPDHDYWAKAECYQGTLVYAQFIHIELGYTTFTAGPTPSWTGGAAECVVLLGYWNQRGTFSDVAVDEFSVAP